MPKKHIILCILTVSICFAFLAGCKNSTGEKEAFPPSDAFASRLELVSAEKTDEGYTVVFDTFIINKTDKAYTIYGNPHCWSVLYKNSKPEGMDLPLGEHELLPKEEFVQRKTVKLSKDNDIFQTEFYIVSDFFLKDSKEEMQFYNIKSEPLFIQKGDVTK